MQSGLAKKNLRKWFPKGKKMDEEKLKLANTLKYHIDILKNEIEKIKNINDICSIVFYPKHNNRYKDNLFSFEKEALDDLNPDDLTEVLLKKYQTKLMKLEKQFKNL